MHQHNLGFQALGQLRKTQAVQEAFVQASSTLQQGEAIVLFHLLAKLVEPLSSVQLTRSQTTRCRCLRKQMQGRQQTLSLKSEGLTDKPHVVID
jgi:uncharacterized protein YjfI (DUF2170 family)